MAATYNPDLVLVSAITAVLASYPALELAGMTTAPIDISRMDSL